MIYDDIIYIDNICCHYIFSFIMTTNNYCHYTLSCIIRNTFSCIRKINIISY